MSRRADRVLTAYLNATVSDGIGDAPIFRNRSGRPYSKDTLGNDFRDVRALVFNAGEKRKMANFRRMGAVKALMGGADPETVSAKMANTLSASKPAVMTYVPVELAKVLDADAARKRGRSKLRDPGGGRHRLRRTKPDKSVRTALTKPLSA